MDSLLEERIRQRAFDLSEDPTRAHLGAIDHWLEAERLIAGGLAEDASIFDAAGDMPAAELSPDDRLTKRSTKTGRS